MNDKLFLSIIIPVYNVENYIRQCLDSIITCSFHSYEIILVTGDSTDKSNIICADYAHNYAHISTLRQSGNGLSNARNCGLTIANGTYIMYIDSDDYVNTIAFTQTLNHFFSLREKKYDVLISDFSLINAENIIYSHRTQIKKSSKIIEDYNYLKNFLSEKGNYWNVWRYIYRHNFLTENNLTFKENYKSEDIDYSTRVLLKMNSCCFYHNPYYCYRVRREGSLVNVITMQNVENLLEILEISIKEIAQHKNFSYASLMKNKLLTEYIFSFLLIRDISTPQKKETLSKINFKLYLLKETFRGKIYHTIISVVGINCISYILYYARQGRRLFLNIH